MSSRDGYLTQYTNTILTDNHTLHLHKKWAQILYQCLKKKKKSLTEKLKTVLEKRGIHTRHPNLHVCAKLVGGKTLTTIFFFFNVLTETVLVSLMFIWCSHESERKINNAFRARQLRTTLRCSYPSQTADGNSESWFLMSVKSVESSKKKKGGDAHASRRTSERGLSFCSVIWIDYLISHSNLLSLWEQKPVSTVWAANSREDCSI